MNNKQKSIIFFDNSEKKWITIPFNNDKNAYQNLKNSNKFNHNIYNYINFNYEDTKISKIQVKSILTKELRNKIDNSIVQRFKTNIENNDLLLLGSVDFNSDSLTEIYWREKRDNTFLKMKLNNSGDISDLSYQSKEELYNYLIKNDSKKLANDLISAFIFSNYKNQILDTETAALFRIFRIVIYWRLTYLMKISN